MASTTELKTRIDSVQSTMKITNAMYMISNNKMRKAKQAQEETAPYFDTLQDTITLALDHMPEDAEDHPYFDERPDVAPRDRKTAYIVITGDKGLAGAYHQNIFKLLEASLEETNNNQIYVIGQVGVHYLASHNIPYDANFMYTAQDPSLGRAREIGIRFVDLYQKKMVDDVYIIYTRMINSMTMEASKLKLLPLSSENFKPEVDKTSTTFELYPTPEAVIDTVVPDTVVGIIYSAMVESYCSEQNSRVLAMRNATDSAKDILGDLELEYNRVRQANITQEITEIVGGARAQKGN